MKRRAIGRLRRTSGVLLPISALPGEGPIGTIGQPARRFVDWLQRAGQRSWHILPLSIPDHTGSPYASLSSDAGNWLMIDADDLRQSGLLPKSWPRKRSGGRRVSYRQAFQLQWAMVRESYRYFVTNDRADHRRRFLSFRRDQRRWLEPYVLFQALKDRHRQQPWWMWPTPWRSPTAARRRLDRPLMRRIELHAYAQWLWHEQWQRLRAYARRRQVQIIGDLPFFVRTDSVDVWAHPELFKLDRHGRPRVVAGAPPDVFSKQGQRWGHPIYRWSAHRRTSFRWWSDRLRLLHQRVDVVRFDHFRGLVHTWNIPTRSNNANHGRWEDSPGQQLLRHVKRAVPDAALIAEDLGPEGLGADDLRQAFHIPTIRVFLFGWNGLPHNPHHPKRIGSDMVYYTSNHDTNTVKGWWQQEAKWYERLHLREHVGSVTDVVSQSIAVAARTQAQLLIIALQDALGLGATARFNRPGRERGNWLWRVNGSALTLAAARKLRRLSNRYVVA